MPMLIVRPLVAFAAVSALVFTLSELHLLKPGIPKAAIGSKVELGDSYRGAVTFGQTCASCHGTGGKGGGIGPKLAGDAISLAQVKAQIDNGGGAMPGGLVSGQPERDVIAYLATIVAAPASKTPSGG
jgi:mono/diheme cytochrome c family protein